MHILNIPGIGWIDAADAQELQSVVNELRTSDGSNVDDDTKAWIIESINAVREGMKKSPDKYRKIIIGQ